MIARILSIFCFVLCIVSCSAHALSVDLYDGKTVNLLDMNLPSDKTYSMQKQRQNMSVDYYSYSADIKPFKSELGMAGVPVLDQGQYGTCVTFASTAGMDARLGLGDFISQQCALQLNVALGSDLWDGAYYPSEVIDPLKKYGVVSQSGCNAKYPSRSVSISVDEYKSRIDKLASDKVSELKYTYYSSNSLSVVKSSVLSGKRVLIAFLLNPSSQNGVKGYDVTIGGVKKYGGLWSCTQSSASFWDWWSYEYNCGQFQAGHEVIVTGYDEAQKLLKIRNSWGTTMGDSGEYYMTYQFFQSQVVDMTVIE